MKKALFYEKSNKELTKCRLCHHNCLIAPGMTGICAVRKNLSGELYSLNYGKIIAEHVDPIEKKPLFHYLPGSLSYSIAALGCNFKCKHCQNADISQVSDYDFQDDFPGRLTDPAEIIKGALKTNCRSIAYTYTEPTIYYEFALETMKLARKKGLRNVWVSNGYIHEKPLKSAMPYLDAINVDLKFFKNESYLKICGAKLNPILNNLKLISDSPVWLEVTTLIIPEINDSPEELSCMARFIVQELNSETPWHLSAFFPTFQLKDKPPTPEKTVNQAYEIGKKAGLKYVYTGNLFNGHQNTHCPECGTLLINRHEFKIKSKLKEKACSECGQKIPII